MKRVGPTIAMGDAQRGVTGDVMGDRGVRDPRLGDSHVAALLRAATTAQPEAPGRSPTLFRAEEVLWVQALLASRFSWVYQARCHSFLAPSSPADLTEAPSSARPLQGAPSAQASQLLWPSWQGKVGTVSCWIYAIHFPASLPRCLR